MVQRFPSLIFPPQLSSLSSVFRPFHFTSFSPSVNGGFPHPSPWRLIKSNCPSDRGIHPLRDRFRQPIERHDEAAQLPPYLAEIFAARTADGRETGAVVFPKHPCRRVAKNPELRLPQCPGQSQRRTAGVRQPLAMKRHMP